MSDPQEPDLLAELRQCSNLPAWLTVLAQPARLGTALVRSIPEFASGTLTLRHCALGRVRMKKGKWTATAKYANYNSDMFATDTKKAWIQLEWAY